MLLLLFIHLIFTIFNKKEIEENRPDFIELVEGVPVQDLSYY